MARHPRCIHPIAFVTAAIAAAPTVGQEPVTGSLVPCAVPMSWSIDRIDSRFDLSSERALAATREAGALWEEAVGLPLFEFGAADGHPIYFDFDERQADVEEGQERDRALESERLGIETRRLQMDEASRELTAAVREYERENTEYGWAVRSYNNDMARLSRQREISPSEQRDIDRQRGQLERMARDLEQSARELNRRSDAINEDVEDFNAWVDAFSRRQQSHVDAFPRLPTEAGHYAETQFWEDGVPDSVTRRIRIFQFADHDGLVRIMAHELGHALGLGHAPSEGAVMSAVDAGAEQWQGITSVDLRMLMARCPDLGR